MSAFRNPLNWSTLAFFHPAIWFTFSICALAFTAPKSDPESTIAENFSVVTSLCREVRPSCGDEVFGSVSYEWRVMNSNLNGCNLADPIVWNTGNDGEGYILPCGINFWMSRLFQALLHSTKEQQKSRCLWACNLCGIPQFLNTRLIFGDFLL